VASKTKRGEPSLMVEDWAMVTKSLVPLPDSWDGLKDDDLRYRNRHLDLLQNDELRDLFIKKAQFWSEIRDYLETKNFIGVETPTLEVTTGGAEARPFKTFHHDYQMEVFLRISVGELWQKRLMAAGVPRTYEIGRVYRNEGSSPEHLQEFTSCEFYAANMNFADGQDMVIDLFRNLAMKVFNTTKFSTRGHTFDLADDWQQLDYVATVEEMTGINVMESDIAQLKARLQELKVDYQGDNRERLMDSLWKYCRKKISGPAILINHPRLLAPLSNPHPDNPELTLTMQPILAGSEVGRGHSELNNPDLQRERFIKQQELLAGGDEEAMMPDWEYVEMMEHGMPPTFGFGFGERLFSFLIDMSIREATLFPLVKPR
jgi:lysyl-tRNA synthetase class 2